MILQASIQEIISLGKYLEDFSKPNSLFSTESHLCSNNPSQK